MAGLGTAGPGRALHGVVMQDLARRGMARKTHNTKDAAMNQETRKEVVKRDKNECQLSKLFGIAHLSGVPCIEEKEVHHKTYKRARDETEEPDDLIVVCRRCHDFLTSYIRSLRYSMRNGDLKLEDVATVMESVVTQERSRNEYPELSDYGRRSADPAQRIASRSTLRRDQVDLKDFKETSQDRGRSGGNGKA